jgi:hypothetical protein
MLEIFTCPQGSDEWRRARMGVPTASEFHSVLAKGQGKTRRKYMLELLGERLTGEPMAQFSNVHTERGHLLEPEARALYSFDVSEPLTQVGFIRRDGVGCSPDSLVGEDGLLEIKTKLPHLQLEVLLDDRVPPEHMAQCQGALWVSGRKWLDFVSYCPGLPLFIKRLFPDEEYFVKLSEALTAFELEMRELAKTLPPIPLTKLPRRVLQIDPTQEFTSLD